MKHFKFYIEYPSAKDKRNKTNGATCIAVFGDYLPGPRMVKECISTWHTDFRSVMSSQYDIGYLRQNCRRVAEAIARAIHPELFSYLER